MESGLTRDGRATTVSHTRLRFGRARRAARGRAAVYFLFIYRCGRSFLTVEYGTMHSRPRRRGCPGGVRCSGVCTAPRARGVTVQVAKDPTRK